MPSAGRKIKIKGGVGEKRKKKKGSNPEATARNGGECVIMVTKATACCPVGWERWKGVLGGRSDGTSS